jgi:hypothetical protein
LQHLQITIGVTKSRDRPAADVTLDADGFAFLVVDEIDSGSRMINGRPSRISNFILMLLPTTCSGGMP